MWKIMICDDEPAMCQQLRELLNRFSEECHFEFLIQEYHSGKELLEHLTFDTDIVFLDIKMEPLSGMDTARIIRSKNQDICLIFITTMTQYAMEGYQVHAFGFLKKPVRYSQFRLQMLDTMRMLQKNKKETFSFKNGSETYNLNLNSIQYFEIYGHDVRIFLTDQTLNYYGTLSELEDALRGKGFYRCHKSYLVNLGHISKITSSEISLKLGTRIPLSKYRRKDLLEQFASYMGGHI